MGNTTMLEFASQLVTDVGTQLVLLHGRTQVLSDTDVKGPLAEADLVSHRAIVGAIRSRYPDHHVISEENDIPETEAPCTWVLDPICGTYNFIRGIPYYAIGLSYIENGRTVLGLIYNPVTRELFHAEKGKGAFLNGQPIRVSRISELSQAVVCFNTNMSSAPGRSLAPELFQALCPPHVARLRLTESANLDLAYVACGRYDAYVHPSDHLWDINAGRLLIQEAGGDAGSFVRDGRYEHGRPGIIAANTTLFPVLLERLKTLLPDTARERVGTWT